MYVCASVRGSVCLYARPPNWYDLLQLKTKGVFIAKQLNSTQLNLTDPVEQRTAKSVMFLFMTLRPTN